MSRPRIPTAILDAKGSLLHHPELRDSGEPSGRQMSKSVPNSPWCKSGFRNEKACVIHRDDS
jgi:hypothetical protein